MNNTTTNNTCPHCHRTGHTLPTTEPETHPDPLYNTCTNCGNAWHLHTNPHLQLLATQHFDPTTGHIYS